MTEAGLDADTAHKVLWHREVWENLVRMSLQKVTAVCAPRARAAVVAALHNSDDTNVGPQTVRSRTQGAVCALGRLSHSRDLSDTPWELLLDCAAEGAAGG